MFKYIPYRDNSMTSKTQLELPEKLYPDIELPKWMISQENAVISLDDL